MIEKPSRYHEYQDGRREGYRMGEYSEYGYVLNGVEYATVDEAYEAQEDR